MSLMIGCHAQALTTRHQGRPHRTRGRALVHARRGRRDADAASIPKGSRTPPPVAIAHHIIRAWVEEGDVSSTEPRKHVLCAGIAVLDEVFRVEAFPRAGRQDAGERIPHHQRRQRGQCGGRDRASRRARELCRPARRPGRRRRGRRHVPRAAPRSENIDCSACPRVAGRAVLDLGDLHRRARRARDRQLSRRRPDAGARRTIRPRWSPTSTR